jgi:hypothetical protein
MFSTESLKKAGVTFVVVLAALAFHQVVVSPRLTKKSAVAAK